MTTRTAAVFGRLWTTALTIAILWAVLLVARNPDWLTEWRASPESLFLVVPITFGPLASVVWLRWLFRGQGVR